MKSLVVITKLDEVGYVLTGYKYNLDTDKLEMYNLDGEGESVVGFEPDVTIGRSEDSNGIENWFDQINWDNDEISFSIPWNNEERWPFAHEVQEHNIVFFL